MPLVFNSPTMSCCGSVRAECTCGGPATNAPATNDDDGDYGPGTDKHEASRAATHASIRAVPSEGAAARAPEHESLTRRALRALSKSKAGDSARASHHHLKAADAHDNHALQLRLAGDLRDALGHESAARLHRKAASIHAAPEAPEDDNADTYSPTENAMKQKQCPECGGKMIDGECDDCGWEPSPTTNGLNLGGLTVNAATLAGFATLAAEVRNKRQAALDTREDILPDPGASVVTNVGRACGSLYGSADSADMLPLPVTNWGAVAAEQRRKVSGDTGPGRAQASPRSAQGGYSTDAQYDVLQDRFLTSAEIAEKAMEDDFIARENRKRQGLDDDLLPEPNTMARILAMNRAEQAQGRPQVPVVNAADDDLLPQPPRSW